MALLKRFSSASLTLLLLALLSHSGQAQQDLGEREVKAAYLYNFAKFVEWPEDVKTLRLCVFGEDPFGRILDGLARDEVISNRKMVVSRPRESQSLRDCQILFISRSERGRLSDLLSSLRGSKVLTVGEADNFLDKGGMINFVMEGGKVRFEISDQVVEESGLKISSKLLRLARREDGL